MREVVEPAESKPVWDQIPLSDLVEFRRGLTYKKSDEVEHSSNSVLRANNIDLDSGTLNLSDIRYISSNVIIPESKRVVSDSLLICTASGSKSHLGKVAYVAEDPGHAFGGFMGLLVPGPRLSARYLYYFTRSAAYWHFIDGLSAGANINNLRFADLGQLVVPLPPLEEQKRIVAVLDQAFAALDRARAHAEANLADAKELLPNALNGIFRETSVTDAVALSDAVHPDCRLSYGIVQPGDHADEGLLVVRPVDLKQRIVVAEGLKKIAPVRAEGYARTKLVGGELLLCVRGSTGEVSIAAPELEGANVTRGIVPVRFDRTRVLPEFAYFQFRSRFMRDQIAEKTYGAALMQINIKDLRSLRFVVPSIPRQMEVVEQAEHLFAGSQRLCGDYVRKLADIANLRQSMLQEAFPAN